MLGLKLSQQILKDTYRTKNQNKIKVSENWGEKNRYVFFYKSVFSPPINHGQFSSPRPPWGLCGKECACRCRRRRFDERRETAAVRNPHTATREQPPLATAGTDPHAAAKTQRSRKYINPKNWCFVLYITFCIINKKTQLLFSLLLTNTYL